MKNERFVKLDSIDYELSIEKNGLEYIVSIIHEDATGPIYGFGITELQAIEDLKRSYRDLKDIWKAADELLDNGK